jgi:cyclohexanecarboxylate-CoA ligase
MKQKWPEQLEVLDVLPRNPAGKVLKKDLREQYARA